MPHDRQRQRDVNLENSLADIHGNVYVAFEGGKGRFGVFINRSSDNGQTWLPNEQRISIFDPNRDEGVFGMPSNTPFAADNYAVIKQGARLSSGLKGFALIIMLYALIMPTLRNEMQGAFLCRACGS